MSDADDASWWKEKAREHLGKLGDSVAENIRLKEALAFYADPETYEQVDVLGLCGLSGDRDGKGYGRRARESLAPPETPR